MNEHYARLSSFLETANAEDLLEAFSQPWLNEIIPEIDLLCGCGQGSEMHLEGDAAVHTSLVFKNILETAERRLQRKADFIERLAAVLHDWKKPKVRTEKERKVSFPGHEKLAAEGVPVVAKKLGLTEDEQAKLYFLVARHGDAYRYPTLPAADQRQLRASPYLESLCLLQEADSLSCFFPDGSRLSIRWEQIMDEKVD